MLTSVVFVLTLLAPVTGSEQPKSVTGTWESGNERKGGGLLLLRQTETKVDFQLELWQGGPAHNMGFMQGQFELKDGKANFIQEEGTFHCRIDFVFQGQQVTLTQLEGSDADCGFGHNVHADGVFRRTSSRPPVFQKLR